jgi:hypothetical protein
MPVPLSRDKCGGEMREKQPNSEQCMQASSHAKIQILTDTKYKTYRTMTKESQCDPSQKGEGNIIEPP